MSKILDNESQNEVRESKNELHIKNLELNTDAQGRNDLSLGQNTSKKFKANTNECMSESSDDYTKMVRMDQTL